jgi:hypothetical protein
MAEEATVAAAIMAEVGVFMVAAASTVAVAGRFRTVAVLSRTAAAHFHEAARPFRTVRRCLAV